MLKEDEGGIKSVRPKVKPFQPGNQHGKGRPPGSRNKATLALQELLNNEGEVILRKTIDLAMTGNAMAQKLCLERLIPHCRERAVYLSGSIQTTTGSEI